MAAPDVTYSFSEGSAIASAELNQNFTDMANAIGDGTKDLTIKSMTAAGHVTAKFEFDGAFYPSVYPIALAKRNGSYMSYTGPATITVKSGYYWVNDKVQQLASDTEWSWTLDGGAEANSTWYYLYLADVAGTLTPVASTVTPTALWNTGLASGAADYDTNVYLGAFHNIASGGSGIADFRQVGNFTMFTDVELHETNTQATAYTAYTTSAFFPESANLAAGSMRVTLAGASGLTSATGAMSLDGTNDYLAYMNRITGTPGNYVYFVCPTTATAYVKSGDLYNKTIVGYTGFYDKWLP